MSVRTEARYFISCDREGCKREHYSEASDSVLSARIAAGIDGWRHATTRPGFHGRRSFDYCPSCEVPK